MMPYELNTSSVYAAVLAALGATPPAIAAPHQLPGLSESWLKTSSGTYGTAVFCFQTANERSVVVVQRDRLTTPREEAIGNLRGWSSLEKNWDGEGANIPNPTSLKDAEYFIDLLGKGYSIPEPMLLANGRAGLYWDEDGLYADLEFLGDGRVTYFIEHRGEGKHKGVVQFRRGEMPPVFAALLRV